MICNLNVEKLILLKDQKPNANIQDLNEHFIEKTVVDFEDDLEFLISIALQNEKVVAVRAFETDDVRVFGVLTLPIYLKSEREALIKTLENELSQGKNTYVSLDNDVYRNIKPNMSDEEKTELLNIVLKRIK